MYVNPYTEQLIVEGEAYADPIIKAPGTDPQLYPVDPYPKIDPALDRMIQELAPDGLLQNVVYSGQVADSVTAEPIAGATVQLLRGGQPVASQAANGQGQFSLSTGIPADQIAISAASYKDMVFPASPYQHNFELEPDVTKLPPVILPPGSTKKDHTWMILAILAVAILASKKKSQ